MNKKRVAIIGLGLFGSALATMIGQSDSVERLYLISSDKDVVEALNKTGKNPRFSWFNVPQEKIHATSDIDNICDPLDVVLIALTSSAILNFFDNWKKVDRNTVIINGTKGISREPIDFFSNIIEQKFDIQLISLSGPNFADEIINPHEVFVTTIAHKNLEKLKICNQLFDNSNIKCYPTDDIIGVQLLSVLKNIIAIIIGFMQATHKSASSIASTLNIAILFVKEILVKFDCNPDTLLLPCGVGDIFLTCNSEKSRNRQLGYNLGSEFLTHKKYDPQKTIGQSNTLCEGAVNISAIISLLRTHDLEFFLFSQLNKLMQNEISLAVFDASFRNINKP